MPAACALLLLLGLGLAPPAASLPLAAPRRLPPPPPPPPPAAGAAGRPVINSSHQARRSTDAATRTSNSLVGDVELTTVLPGSGAERSAPPASTGALALPGTGGTASSPPGPGPPPATGSWVRGRRALASPGDPADTERTLTLEPALSSSPASWVHRVLPSTPVPGSSEQPLSSPHAPSTQMDGRGTVLHPKDVTGSSASPELTALSASKNVTRAAGSSYQPSDGPVLKKSMLGFHATSDSVSTTATRGTGRTLRSLPASTSLAHPAGISTSGTDTSLAHLAEISTSGTGTSPAHPAEILTSGTGTSPAHPAEISTSGTGTSSAHPVEISTSGTGTSLAHLAEISTSGTETVDPSDQTRSPGPPLAAEAGGGTGATASSADPLLADRDSTSMSSRGSEGPKSIPAEGEVMLHSDVPLALTNTATGTLGSSPSSATSHDPTGILGGTLSSSGAEAHWAGSWQWDTNLTEHPREPLLTSSLSASKHTFAGVRSSHQPTGTSTTEEETSASSGTSAYVSATATGSVGRPPRSVTNSSRWAVEVSASSTGVIGTLGTMRSSPASSVRETHGAPGSRETPAFSQPGAEPSLSRSPSPAGGPSTATGSSQMPFSIPATERRIDFHATSDSVSTTATRGTGRTLRSLPASTSLAHPAEISTSGTGTGLAHLAEILTSGTGTNPAHPAEISTSGTGTSLAHPAEISTSGTGTSLAHPAEISTSGIGTSLAHPAEISTSGTGTSLAHPAEISTSGTGTSLAHPAEISTSGTGTSLAHPAEISTSVTETIDPSDWTRSPGPPLRAESGGGTSATVSSTGPLLADLGSTSTAEGATTSARGGSLPDAPVTSTPTLVMVTSSEDRTTEPVVDTRAGSSAPAVSQSDADLSELPTKLLPVFPRDVLVSSSSPSASVSERGRRVSGVPTETTYVLTVVSTHEEKTSQDAANRGTWSMAMGSPTSRPDVAMKPHSSPVPSSPAWPGGGHLSSSRAVYTEPEVTSSSRVSSYFSATGEPSTVGSSHHSLSSSSREEGISSPHSDPVYVSATLAGGGEGTPMTNSTLAGSMESSASHTKTASASEPIQLVLVEQSGTANASAGREGFATETFFTRSSKIPTDSSFQRDLTSFSSSRQPVSGVDAEKRTSVSHTDGTYISTTYSRGGERTLLSISNSSASADSSESSTFFSEISNPSDSSKSPVVQDRKNNVSSDGSFAEPSTEPLLVHSSKPLTSASVDNVQNTTVFGTDSELLPTGRSSLSSSAFPPSSSVSSLHRSLSSTPPPTYLYATSKSSEPLSSSMMASSPSLQASSSSLPTSSLLSSSYSSVSLLPLFSSPSSVSQSNDSGPTSTPAATTVTKQVPSTATVTGSSSQESSKHGGTHQPQNNTSFTPTMSPIFPTEPMEHRGGHVVSMSASTPVTETTSPRGATSQGGSSGKATLLPTTASNTPQAEPTDVPLGTSPSTTSHNVIVPAVALTTVKPIVLTTPASHQPTLGDASTAKTHRAPTPTATKHIYTTGKSTEAVDLTTAMPSEVTKEIIPATSLPEAPPTSKTTVSTRTTLATTKPTTIPPLSSTAGVRTTSPVTDVDKCLSNPCPALATCNNTHGSYVCHCPLGYELEKGKCNLVRIFIGQVPLKLNITHGKYADLLHVEREILAMLDASLSGLPGYYHSTVKATREANFVHVSVQSTFSLASNVTFYDVISSVKSYIRACKSPPDPCQFISSLKPLHRVGSLCKQKDPKCDKETSECTDFDGVALCQCKSGYFKYNKMDHSCRACEDGYKLENETCVSCPFGLGGFNCGNPYQLITVVIAAAGGGLLLIMGIALIVTCCRKNKNDISKLIFKSGDFQMSPYAEYPKNPRAPEWGRETIEMQENGSTKNLLQMTDVYYSPTGLRNPELERNGLYPPYTGLPGSRHSCIYPGQYNPSFISDETRRRDYF